MRAVGAGVVARAGRASGYGNVLEIRHRDGVVSRYGYLRGFARGVRAGQRVRMGETVAYVGSTGRSTGPHLHFEVLVGGEPREPREPRAPGEALRARAARAVEPRERAAFAALRSRLLARLDRPVDATPGRLALGE